MNWYVPTPHNPVCLALLHKVAIMPQKQHIAQNKKQRSDFNKGAADSPIQKHKISVKKIAFITVPILCIAGYFWISSLLIPPKGNSLYGLCRGYIELQLQFPQTLKIIEFKQSIPKGENPNSPQRILYDITFSSIDGFGSRGLHTVTCGFKFNKDLANTPWQGIFLEEVLYDRSKDHGWADIYYPPNDPRAVNDTNKRLEKFFNAIPSLLINPPDLTLPWHNINKMDVKDLQDL